MNYTRMGKIFITGIVAALLIISSSVFGQSTEPDTLQWKRKFNFAINFNQASFSSNWKAGGVNSLGFNTLFNYKANYKDDRRSWDNDLDFAFGFVNNSGQGYRKTIDRIFIDTKYGYEITDDWSVFSSLSFVTQFAPGHLYAEDNSRQLISDIMAPAFITSAWGFEYHPVDYFKLRLAPFAPRLTIVTEPRRFTKSVGTEPYGVDSTETTRFEILAFQLLAEFNKEVVKNVNLKSRYMMFANYNTFEPKTLDHRLDIDIVAKVNKFINVGLGGILLYDFDQDSGAQISQVFSFGFLYTFQNYTEDK
ncbi:MAG TPA: DUF3078 domain-containing protein [Chryseosolibacter sp.]|nr:DUF3078 domain-containing protein [Chryseosolibacter sp.]